MKFLIVCLFIVSALFSFPPSTFAERSYYAKIEENEVFFYSQPSKNSQYQLFEIPCSYFVLLTSEENEDFYCAKYKDINGYVLKNKVTVMNGTPLNPYFDASFRVFAPDGIGLFLSPYQNENNKILTIPFLSQSAIYYGSIDGEQMIPDKSNQWHYCKYENSFGFVYSVFCDKLTNITFNNEKFPVLENPIFFDQTFEDKLSKASMALIVIGVSLPCLVVIYLLLKPTFMKERILNEMPKTKKKRHKDYYEFDSSDLS